MGATIYFDNMSSEETAELLKTLNRHKVGLKLQNRGEKSPYSSPLSTPCRSPIGTLTWEGKTRYGGSSPDIILVSCFSYMTYLFVVKLLDTIHHTITFTTLYYLFCFSEIRVVMMRTIREYTQKRSNQG